MKCSGQPRGARHGARRGRGLLPAAAAGRPSEPMLAVHVAMLVSAVIVNLVAAQYNPQWGPSPCPKGQCVPTWPPTYNVRAPAFHRALARSVPP
jgi:hypothetical protein